MLPFSVGDQQGYNIPEITHLRQFQQWLENEAVLKETGDKDLPAPLRRLLCDGYMCMYQDPEVVKQHTKQFQQTTPIDKIAEPLPALPFVRERSASNEMQVEESIYVVPSIASGKASTSSYGLNPSQPPNYLDMPTPAISYTTHRGSSQIGTKAAANAALTYRNYADALTSPPHGSATKGVSNPAAEYRKYAEVASGPATNGSKFGTSTYKQPQTQQQGVRSRGSSFDDSLSSNSTRQHVGVVAYDDDPTRQYRGDTSSTHSRDSQYTSLPAEYSMSLSKEADLYSRPKEPSVIVNQKHHIRHPPSRTDFQVTDVVSDAPIPRDHHTRVPVTTSQPRNNQYSSNRYHTNSDSSSASRLAKHGIRQPPIDDEYENLVAGFSLHGSDNGTAI